MVFPSSTVIFIILEQPEKALTLMLETLFGITIVAKLEHEKKALVSMLVIPLGISTFVKLLQLANALLPIPMTL